MSARKLLLADDSITIQKVVNLTFADEGIEVLTVSDGDSAAQRVSEDMPDIVLADVNMPGLNGYQVCEHIRSDNRTRHIPVILLVGAFEQFDEAEAERVGSSAHLTKPFQSIRQLVNQVTDLIQSSRPASVAPPEQESITGSASESASTVSYETNPFEEPVASRLESFREDRISSIDQDREPLTVGAEVAPDTDTAPETAKAPEAEDIDKLYRQSMGEERIPDEEQFPDLGLDDEMIETSYTAPPSVADELGLSQQEPDFDNTIYRHPEGVIESYQARSTVETTELNPVDVPETLVSSSLPQTDQTIRLDPAMVEAKMAEENRRFEHTEQPVRSPQTAIGEETIRMDSRFDTRGSAAYEFDDVDLLDIPSGAEVEITSPPDAVGKSGKQLVTLSPELIEMIAQRVVEKLSEKY